MRRIGTVLVVVLAVVGVLPVVGVQAAAPTADVDSGSMWRLTMTADAGNSSETADVGNSSETAPGTRLAGSVGVQGAELGGELETRSFEHQVNRSNSNASKAAVVARQANQSQGRLAALRTQLRDLEAARADGRISETEYRVRAAQLSARVAALEQVTNRTTETAQTLPAETLRQNGVNVTALETLRAEAGRLTGPEVAALARSVAGPGAARGKGNAANASGGNAGASGSPEDTPGRSRAERAENASASGGPPETAGESSTGNETATGSDQQRDGEGADGNGQGSPAEGERGTDRTGSGGSGNDRGGGDANRDGNSGEARERGSGASDRSVSEESDTDRT